MTVQDTCGNTVEITGDIPELPRRNPLTQEVLEKSLQKLGGTIYTCGGVQLENPAGLFLSSAQCNALRRAAAEQMDALRVQQQTPSCIVRKRALTLPSDRTAECAGSFRLHVRTSGQCNAALESGAIVCIPLALAEQVTPSAYIYLEAPRVVAQEA